MFNNIQQHFEFCLTLVTMKTNLKHTRRERNSIELDLKIKILDFLESVAAYTFMAKGFALNEATVRTIGKNEILIRQSMLYRSNVSAKAT